MLATLRLLESLMHNSYAAPRSTTTVYVIDCRNSPTCTDKEDAVEYTLTDTEVQEEILPTEVLDVLYSLLQDDLEECNEKKECAHTTKFNDVESCKADVGDGALKKETQGDLHSQVKSFAPISKEKLEEFGKIILEDIAKTAAPEKSQDWPAECKTTIKDTSKEEDIPADVDTGTTALLRDSSTNPEFLLSCVHDKNAEKFVHHATECCKRFYNANDSQWVDTLNMYWFGVIALRYLKENVTRRATMHNTTNTAELRPVETFELRCGLSTLAKFTKTYINNSCVYFCTFWSKCTNSVAELILDNKLAMRSSDCDLLYGEFEDVYAMSHRLESSTESKPIPVSEDEFLHITNVFTADSEQSKL